MLPSISQAALSFLATLRHICIVLRHRHHGRFSMTDTSASHFHYGAASSAIYVKRHFIVRRRASHQRLTHWYARRTLPAL